MCKLSESMQRMEGDPIQCGGETSWIKNKMKVATMGDCRLVGWLV